MSQRNGIIITRTVWTPPRIGALAVRLWEQGVLYPCFTDGAAVPATFDVDCADCSDDSSDPTARFVLRGPTAGSIVCDRCRRTIDAAEVLERYALCLADLDALIAPADRVIDGLRRQGILLKPERQDTAYELLCQFRAASDVNHDQIGGAVSLDAEFGVYQCLACRHDDGRGPGAFGTLGQLAQRLNLDMRPSGASAATAANH